MKGKAELGKKNRAIIIAELLENPTTFSQLKQKLGFSAKTLTLHLRALENEGLAKREIHGRFVLYTVNKPETILELRKQLYSQLLDLHVIYGSVLNEKTNIPLQESLKALKESIEKPEKEAKTTKTMVKIIEIPEGFKKGTIRQKITNLYEKPELKEAEQPKSKKKYSKNPLG
jgi:DNA-binding transcriptional ArsR family regulator